MHCAICNRPMYREGLQIGRLIVGPKCARKILPAIPKQRRVFWTTSGQKARKQDGQLDLFGMAA